MSLFWVSKLAHVCLSGNQVVLLDLEKDQYIMLDIAHKRVFPTRLHWHVLHSASALQPMTIEDPSILRLLEERSVINPAALDATQQMHVQTPCEVLLPTLWDKVDRRAASHPASTYQVLACYRAVASARLMLITLSIERLLKEIIQRRQRCGWPMEEFEFQEARQEVQAFRRIRYRTFTVSGQRLIESLALLNYLSYYGWCPHWIFGVQTEPFSAHCWVQEGAILFDDTVENVSRYRPIMAV